MIIHRNTFVVCVLEAFFISEQNKNKFFLTLCLKITNKKNKTRCTIAGGVDGFCLV